MTYMDLVRANWGAGEYRLMSPASRIYVGSSWSLAERIADHARTCANAAYYKWTPGGWHTQLESEFIRHPDPKLWSMSSYIVLPERCFDDEILVLAEQVALYEIWPEHIYSPPNNVLNTAHKIGRGRYWKDALRDADDQRFIVEAEQARVQEATTR